MKRTCPSEGNSMKGTKQWKDFFSRGRNRRKTMWARRNSSVCFHSWSICNKIGFAHAPRPCTLACCFLFFCFYRTSLVKCVLFRWCLDEVSLSRVMFFTIRRDLRRAGVVSSGTRRTCHLVCLLRPFWHLGWLIGRSRGTSERKKGHLWGLGLHFCWFWVTSGLHMSTLWVDFVY